MVFIDYDDIAEYIYDEVSDGKCVHTIMFYEDARNLIKCLAEMYEIKISSIVLHEPDWEGYTKEYAVIVDKDFNLYVEKCYHEDNEYHKAGYYRFESDVVLIDENASPSALSAINDPEIIEFSINEEDFYDNIVNAIDFTDVVEYIFDKLFNA